jgi:hypothetical protein
MKTPFLMIIRFFIAMLKDMGYPIYVYAFISVPISFSWTLNAVWNIKAKIMFDS